MWGPRERVVVEGKRRSRNVRTHPHNEPAPTYIKKVMFAQTADSDLSAKRLRFPSEKRQTRFKNANIAAGLCLRNLAICVLIYRFVSKQIPGGSLFSFCEHKV